MTLLRIVSDVHSELWECNATKAVKIWERFVCPRLDTDKDTILLLAGDIGNLKQKLALFGILENCSQRFKQIMYIYGNHEFYRGCINDNIGTGVSYDGEVATKYWDKVPELLNLTSQWRYNNSLSDRMMIEGHTENIVIFGSTLWTDFAKANPLVMNDAMIGMNDYKAIKGITPDEVLKIHHKTKEYLLQGLEYCRAKGLKAVIMTHHAPSWESIAQKYRTDPLNGCYASDLTDIILEYQPALWVHGHLHNNSDYMIGNTRVICNPYGYKDFAVNKGFNPKLVIEV